MVRISSVNKCTLAECCDDGGVACDGFAAGAGAENALKGMSARATAAGRTG